MELKKPWLEAGGPAFPQKVGGEFNSSAYYKGATLRDYFAARAPECPSDWPFTTDPSPLVRLAQWNYAYADAMLAERTK